MFGFTREQNQAIFARPNKDILVAAAAGSGKTAVLVERIVALITDEQNPVDINRLLVVTFTEAAALEMRQRISNVLLNKLDKDPHNPLLLKQAALLNKAPISTIHSFCAGFLRANFYLTDIDPSFRICDATESAMLKKQALKELLEENYANQSEVFLNLAECFGGKITDDGLEALVLQIYEYINNMPKPQRWMEEHVEMFCQTENFNLTPWGITLEEAAKMQLQSALEETDYALSLAPDHYINTLLDDKEQIERLLHCCHNLHALEEALAVCAFSRLPGTKCEHENKKKVQDIRKNSIKGVVQKMRKQYFPKPFGEMLEDLRNCYPMVKELCRLATEFGQRYSAYKKERNLADFNDLERYTLEILLSENVAHGKYAEIMVDEYQDSNAVQELILTLMARPNVSRFMVGDVKQSIYKFRRAAPSIFLEKYHRFQEGDEGMRIILSKNFRSRQPVLDAVNFIFSRIMSRQLGEIDYDNNASLAPGDPVFSQGGGQKEVSLHIVESVPEEDEELEVLTAAEWEAKLVAQQIKQIMGSHKLEYKDIVILMRSISGVGQVFADTLKEYDIPAFCPAGHKYFDSVEVATALSFLQIIDNPRQDIPLITVLRSPVYMLNDDELLDIRQSHGQGTFYEAVLNYQQNNTALQKFLNDLSKWRDLAVTMPVSQLIALVLEDTHYFNYAGVMPAGSLRQANLRALSEKAALYEDTSFKGLFHFIRYIEEVKAGGNALAEAKSIAENENVVRIMTIHKCKGLEFPVVFVSMLGRKFNQKDLQAKMLLHERLGFGPAYIDLQKRTKANSLARVALTHQMFRENLSEEMRVLYVAMTRAKERLVLTGSVRNLSSSMEKWRRYENTNSPIVVDFLLKLNSFLGWVATAIYSASNREPFEIITHPLKEVAAADRKVYDQLEMLTPVRNISGLADEIEQKLNWRYFHFESTQRPAKLTISEIGDGIAAPPPIVMPNFMQKQTGITVAQKGTLMHMVLEHIDPRIHKTIEDLEHLLNTMVKRNLLTNEEKKHISRKKILNFMQSELAMRIANAEFVKRELPFVMVTEEQVLVNGIIDCYFSEGGFLTLVDYKSASTADPKEHTLQMKVYKKALEESTGQKVKECVLYLLGSGQTIVM